MAIRFLSGKDDHNRGTYNIVMHDKAKIVLNEKRMTTYSLNYGAQ